MSSHPATPHAVTPAEAMALLRRLVDVGDHVFLDDDTSMVEAAELDRARIVSHRQVTDAHVLALARRHGGRLATFDRGVRQAFSRGDRDPTIVLLGRDAV